MQPVQVKKVIIPTPYLVGPVNTYLFTGQGVQLVDCGPDTPEAFHTLEMALAEQQLSLCDINDVYITHAHPDHCGMAGRLSQLGITIHLEPREYDRLYRIDDHIRRMTDYLIRCSVPQHHIAALQAFYARDCSLTAPLIEFEPLCANQSVILGGQQWQCHSLPGHAIGHIGFFQPERQVLIDGDVLMDRLYTSPVLEPVQDQSGTRYSSMRLYVQSLEKIRTMGVRELWPGHGEAITNISRRMSEVWKHSERRKQQLLKVLPTELVSIYELCCLVYGQQQKNILFTISDVLGQLDILVDEGKALIRPINESICVQKAESSQPAAFDQ